MKMVRVLIISLAILSLSAQAETSKDKNLENNAKRANADNIAVEKAIEEAPEDEFVVGISFKGKILPKNVKSKLKLKESNVAIVGLMNRYEDNVGIANLPSGSNVDSAAEEFRQNTIAFYTSSIARLEKTKTNNEDTRAMLNSFRELVQQYNSGGFYISGVNVSGKGKNVKKFIKSNKGLIHSSALQDKNGKDHRSPVFPVD